MAKKIPHRFLTAGDKEFAENLVSLGVEFIYQPSYFRIGDTRYTPDFYVPSEQIYYEVITTRQAMNQDRSKIEMVYKLYPFVKIKICWPDGRSYRLQVRRDTMNQIKPQTLDWRRIPIRNRTPLVNEDEVIAFPSKLKELRRFLSISQAKLAKCCGFKNGGVVAHWESGRGLPQRKSLEKILEVFNLSPTYFFERDYGEELNYE